MNKQGNQNLGDEIKDIVQDVLNTNNFNKLNQDIGRTVNSALHDLENMVFGKPKYQGSDVLWEPLSKEPQSEGERTKPNGRENYNRGDEDDAPKGHSSNEETEARYRRDGDNGFFCKSPKGKVSGILLMVFGILGIVIFGGTLATYAMAATFFNINAMINGIAVWTTFPFLVASAFMTAKGISLRRRTNRFYRYVAKIGTRNLCNIKELAAAIGKSEKFVAKDIEKMIYLGMFTQSHLDGEKKCLMLDDTTYKHYVDLQKWTEEQKKLAEQEKQEAEKRQEAQMNENESQKLLRVTIEEGQSYIAQIRKANDDIPGEAVSIKLDRLEAITGRIFQHIETHPEQIPEIRKFMNYYLPTTLKLTNAYRELDGQPAMGENISSAKDEIQKTLDTINLAFENLLDKLFYHAAMDISSDISVLETLFAQEGLTQKDFASKNKKTEE